MAPIAKTDLNQALQLAAKTIVDARGGDDRISRDELRKALTTTAVPRNQRALVDIFFKFIDSAEWKSGPQATVSDVERAVEFARRHLVEKYDLNSHRLTKEELQKMALAGKRAVDLARALKALGRKPADDDDEQTAPGE